MKVYDGRKVYSYKRGKCRQSKLVYKTDEQWKFNKMKFTLFRKGRTEKNNEKHEVK